MDQIRQLNFRQKGTIYKGQIYKGTHQDPAFKSLVGSIPTAYETIIYKHNSAKAFNSSVNRFHKFHEQPIPGPGNYQDINNNGKAAVSFSKKGFGTLINKQQRKVFAPKFAKEGPGPGAYKFKSSKSLEGVTFNKSKYNPQAKIQKQGQVPGPGKYQSHSINKIGSFGHMFNSKTQKLRSITVGTSNDLSYDLNRDLIKKKPYKEPLSHVFKKNEKKFQQPLQKIFSVKEQPLPGPGEYNPLIPSFKPTTNQFSSSFVNQITNRFGEVEGKYKVVKNKLIKDYPGPGSYQISKKYKKQGFNWNFVSSTERQKLNKYQRTGPTLCSPYQKSKRSFMLNSQKKWV